jgi:DNA-binding NarL/FixJ family response regulator
LPIRILIADDHTVVRAGIHAVLATDPDLEIVGEADSGEATLRLTESLKPDMVLLDITMPGKSGIQTAKRLREDHPDVLVLFLTMHEDESLLHAALRVGAAGYVVKRAEVAEILQAVHAASRGDVYIHPSMTRALLPETVAAIHRPSGPVEELTPREIDVLRLLAKGNINRQIGTILGISVRTVENHRANLMGKLQLSSRVDLVSYAEENDLI